MHYGVDGRNTTRVGELRGVQLDEGCGDVTAEAGGRFALLAAAPRGVSPARSYSALSVALADAAVVANVSVPSVPYLYQAGFAQHARLAAGGSSLTVVAPVSNYSTDPFRPHFLHFAVLDQALAGGPAREVARFLSKPLSLDGQAATSKPGGLSAYDARRGRLWFIAGGAPTAPDPDSGAAAALLLSVDMRTGSVPVNATAGAPPGLVALEFDATTGELHGVGADCKVGLPTPAPTPAPPPAPPRDCSDRPRPGKGGKGYPCSASGKWPGPGNATDCAASGCCWDGYNNWCWSAVVPPPPPQRPARNFCVVSVDPLTGEMSERAQIPGGWQAVQPGLSAYDPATRRLFLVVSQGGQGGTHLAWVDVATGESGHTDAPWCGTASEPHVAPRCPTVLRFLRSDPPR